MKPEHAMVEYLPAIDKLIAHYSSETRLPALEACPLCAVMQAITLGTDFEDNSGCHRNQYSCPWPIYEGESCFTGNTSFTNLQNGDTPRDRIERLERWKWDIMQASKPVEVSFWFHWKRRQRKIKLSKANKYRVELSHSEPHEEGYSYESANFTMSLSVDGWIVEQIAETGGRDCDGEVSHTYEKFALVSELSAGNPMPKKWDDNTSMWIWDDEKMQPKWSESKCRVYDQFAQMAGY
jgi:hypothetical protein